MFDAAPRRGLTAATPASPRLPNAPARRALGPRSSKYWARRVFLGHTTRNRKTYFTPNYCVKIQRAGQRELFGLNTADKEEATKLAEEIYFLIRSGPDGWQRVVDNYRKKMVVRKDDPMIGDYLKAVKELADSFIARTKKR